jgi:hypothetical protein
LSRDSDLPPMGAEAKDLELVWAVDGARTGRTSGVRRGAARCPMELALVAVTVISKRAWS